MNKNRPWYRYSRGSGIIFFYVVALHLVTIAGLIVCPLPSLPVVIATIALALLGALGTTLGYHRSLCHRGVEFNPWVEQILIFLSIVNGNTSPRVWIATHRMHHANADTPADVSSPHHGGFWWSHLRWLWQADFLPSEKFCPDLNKPRYRFWDKIYLPIIFVSAMFGLCWGVSAWIWLGPLRLLVALHGQCAVNSICHLGQLHEGHGKDGGSSLNVWWLTPFLLGVGENWHMNHHRNQMNPRLGLKPWEVDIGWWSIRALKALGLVRRIRES